MSRQQKSKLPVATVAFAGVWGDGGGGVGGGGGGGGGGRGGGGGAGRGRRPRRPRRRRLLLLLSTVRTWACQHMGTCDSQYSCHAILFSLQGYAHATCFGSMVV